MEEFGPIVAAAISVRLNQDHALSQLLYMIVRTAVLKPLVPTFPCR
jgi:hypothetical protein